MVDLAGSFRDRQRVPGDRRPNQLTRPSHRDAERRDQDHFDLVARFVMRTEPNVSQPDTDGGGR